MIVRPLKGYGAFDTVLQHGNRITVGPVGLTVVVANQEKPSTIVHVGVAVGKRTASRSVTRSRIRRLLREAMRMVVPRLEAEISRIGISAIVVFWRRPVLRSADINLADVAPFVYRAMENMLTQLNRKANA